MADRSPLVAVLVGTRREMLPMEIMIIFMTLLLLLIISVKENR